MICNLVFPRPSAKEKGPGRKKLMIGRLSDKAFDHMMAFMPVISKELCLLRY